MRITLGGVARSQDAASRNVETPRDVVARQLVSCHPSWQMASLACGVKRPSRIDGCDMTDRDVCLDFGSLGVLWVSVRHVVCALKILRS